MSKTTRTEADAEALVKRLTLEEKIALTAAVDWWRTAKINWDGVYLPHIKVCTSSEEIPRCVQY
jgi:hypothetical protein